MICDIKRKNVPQPIDEVVIRLTEREARHLYILAHSLLDNWDAMDSLGIINKYKQKYNAASSNFDKLFNELTANLVWLH